jgi:hypothetical protein
MKKGSNRNRRNRNRSSIRKNLLSPQKTKRKVRVRKQTGGSIVNIGLGIAGAIGVVAAINYVLKNRIKDVDNILDDKIPQVPDVAAQATAGIIGAVKTAATPDIFLKNIKKLQDDIEILADRLSVEHPDLIHCGTTTQCFRDELSKLQKIEVERNLKANNERYEGVHKTKQEGMIKDDINVAKAIEAATIAQSSIHRKPREKGILRKDKTSKTSKKSLSIDSDLDRDDDDVLEAINAAKTAQDYGKSKGWKSRLTPSFKKIRGTKKHKTKKHRTKKHKTKKHRTKKHRTKKHRTGKK